MTLFDVYLACRPMLARRYGEDAAQEAGEKLLTHPPHTTNDAQLCAWLSTVAFHARGKARRRVKREVLTTEGVLLDPVHDPLPALEARMVLRQLPREIVRLGILAEGANRGRSASIPMTPRERSQLHRYRQGYRKGRNEE